MGFEYGSGLLGTGIQFKRGLLQAAVLYAYGTYYYGDGSMGVNLPMMVGLYPVPTVLAATGLATGIIADTIHDKILPSAGKSGKNQKYKRQNTAVASAFIHAAVYGGILYYISPNAASQMGLPMLAIQAAGSDMIAEYVGNMLF